MMIDDGTLKQLLRIDELKPNASFSSNVRLFLTSPCLSP